MALAERTSAPLSMQPTAATRPALAFCRRVLFEPRPQYCTTLCEHLHTLGPASAAGAPKSPRPGAWPPACPPTCCCCRAPPWATPQARPTAQPSAVSDSPSWRPGRSACPPPQARAAASAHIASSRVLGSCPPSPPSPRPASLELPASVSTACAWACPCHPHSQPRAATAATRLGLHLLPLDCQKASSLHAHTRFA